MGGPREKETNCQVIYLYHDRRGPMQKTTIRGESRMQFGTDSPQSPRGIRASIPTQGPAAWLGAGAFDAALDLRSVGPTRVVESS